MKEKEWLMDFVPKSLLPELSLAVKSRNTSISEMRFRSDGKNTVSFMDERVSLRARPTSKELAGVLKEICNGALWGARESLRAGYVTLKEGVRVGICADARYDGGRFVGIGDPTSLIFRIPTASSDDAAGLYSAWQTARRGILIYSPPGVGKTTALRTLIPMIASGKDALNVAIIDERAELFFEEGTVLSVDAYRGYKRRDGLEIALRTAAPDVIVIDEIGGEGEVLEMLGFLNSGVRIIATAHAGDFRELTVRAGVSEMLSRGIFDVAAGISFSSGKRKIAVSRLDF